MNHDSAPELWPQSIAEAFLPDEAFARAYDALSPSQRSWIKKTVAQLYGSLEQQPPGLRAVRLPSHAAQDKPCQTVLLLLHEDFFSPAQTAAIVLPARMGGVEQFIALRVSENPETPWPASVLAALELTGVENAASLDDDMAAAVIAELAQGAASCRVLHPGPACTGKTAQALNALVAAQGGQCVWSPPPATEARVWAGPGIGWDLETMVWAHPGMRFTLWGADEDLPGAIPKAFLRGGADPEQFWSPGPAVAYAPAGMLQRWAGAPALVLGPGQEGCWVWPGLTSDWFRIRTQAWT